MGKFCFNLFHLFNRSSSRYTRRVNRVRLLSEHVANQIAAGEVVERPASVAKELLENALDAESARVEIQTEHGGRSLVRVTDDGFGMSRDDALLALERHATSKISIAEDLENIATLGFRGEALPSIAAVSRFTLTTRERDASAATQIIVSAGKIREVKEVGAPQGTSIEVRSLFFNLPARRKFLRSDNTENSYIQHITVLHALAHPRVAFKLIQDERELFHFASAEDLQGRIRELFGAQLSRELLPVNFSSGGVRVHGFIARPGVSRSNRSDEYLFVNNRPVDAKTIHFALLEGFHTALMKGRYPVAFLFVELDPTQVDVNVHPTKREVRFRDDASVRYAVTEAIRAALGEAAVKPISSATVGRQSFAAAKGSATFQVANQQSSQAGTPVPPNPNASETLALSSTHHRPLTTPIPSVQPFNLEPSPPPVPSPTQTALGLKIPQVSGFIPSPSTSAPIPISSTTSLRLLGVVSALYVLAESNEGLVVIDQHAAHERVLFEQMLQKLDAAPVPAQRLLLPETVEFSHRDAAFLREHLDQLRRIGIGIEEFGQNTYLIESLPDFLVCFRQKGIGHLTLQQIFLNIVDELFQSGADLRARRLDETAIATTVCRHAVKARDPLKLAEIEALLRDLAKCDLPYTCPHGRPTMIQISHAELEKKFGRKV